MAARESTGPPCCTRAADGRLARGAPPISAHTFLDLRSSHAVLVGRHASKRPFSKMLWCFRHLLCRGRMTGHATKPRCVGARHCRTAKLAYCRPCLSAIVAPTSLHCPRRPLCETSSSHFPPRPDDATNLIVSIQCLAALLHSGRPSLSLILTRAGSRHPNHSRDFRFAPKPRLCSSNTATPSNDH